MANDKMHLDKCWRELIPSQSPLNIASTVSIHNYYASVDLPSTINKTICSPTGPSPFHSNDSRKGPSPPSTGPAGPSSSSSSPGW
jgi:hypothetical protein